MEQINRLMQWQLGKQTPEFITFNPTNYFGTMAKIHIGSDIIKLFSGEDDMVAWLKKVRLVARLQQGDNVVSLLSLYLVGMC